MKPDFKRAVVVGGANNQARFLALDLKDFAEFDDVVGVPDFNVAVNGLKTDTEHSLIVIIDEDMRDSIRHHQACEMTQFARELGKPVLFVTNFDSLEGVRMDDPGIRLVSFFQAAMPNVLRETVKDFLAQQTAGQSIEPEIKLASIPREPNP